MTNLTSEILKINKFAYVFFQEEHSEKIINFLISLDLLVKGMLSHWQIKLSSMDSVRGSETFMLKDMDVKFPLLLGD